MYIEILREVDCLADMCGRANYWLPGFRPAAAAWEKHHSERFEVVGFKKGCYFGVVIYDTERDLSLVVHGVGLTLGGRFAVDPSVDEIVVRNQSAGDFRIGSVGRQGSGACGPSGQVH